MRGFTLIELVITIVLSSILAAVVSVFITRPVTAYSNMTRRAELVDSADLALGRMVRDIQAAVPNSLRIKTDTSNPNRIAIEFLNVVEGMRYRAAGPGAYLSFTQTNTQFNTIGLFQFALTNSICAANNCRVVIYNTGANLGGAIPADNPAPGQNVYSLATAPACTNCVPPPGSVTITPVGTSVTLANGSTEGSVTLSTGVQFAFSSPRQRVQIVDTPVTYICDFSNGVQQITRYWNYTINAVQPTNPTSSPLSTASNAILATDISNCSFTYSPGTSEQDGIISMVITLSKGGESITLMRQVEVDNSP
jgi:MSHA biogenesis protein MshO